MAQSRLTRNLLAGVAVTATVLAGAPGPAHATAHATAPAGGARVEFQQRLQPIDGFGISQAFQRASLIRGARGLTPENQRQVLDLLFDRSTGAGLSILRLGIGSSPETPYDLMPTIQPEDPGGPTAPPRYVWDGDDGGQVWLAQEAQKYGVQRFYADAWSAPGYMKTNGSDSNGGELCGSPGTECASGDWRQAYANYLVQYARFYAQEGIRLTDLGFTNEPELTTSYASMRFTPEQAVDMIKVLGPTVRRSGLDLNIACCDAAGWQTQAQYSAAISADRLADRYTSVHTGHIYTNPIDGPLPTNDRTWMSEWSPNGDTWNEAWDDGSGWAGITVAESIHDTFTLGNGNGYVYWFGASLGATRGLIQLDSDGPGYHVSKRLWALAAYSRFIRPGASRVVIEGLDPAVKATAFRNPDGSKVVELLNTATEPVTAGLTLTGRHGPAEAATFLTDEANALTRTDSVTVRRNHLAGELPARSLTTVVLER